MAFAVPAEPQNCFRTGFLFADAMPQTSSSNVSVMLLNIRLFARAKDLAGSETISVEVPDNSTVGDLRSSLREQFPSLDPLISNLHVAIGTDYADDTAALDNSQSISCFPPVSGG
jgi:sulfur-carrier protein